MRKIKIYLQYPWKISDSQYYKSILDFPPENVEYLSNIDNFGIVTNRKKFFFNLIKRNVRKFIEFLNFPLINAKVTTSKNKFDLIHCAHCLSLNDSPWVADFEAPWQFWISGRDTKTGKERVRKILNSKNCRALLAWTAKARQEMIELFPEIEKKVKILPYGQPQIKINKKRHNGTNLLFVGRYFYLKGGLHAVEAMDRITREDNSVRGIIISNTPKKILDKYSKNKNLKFMPLMPREKLFKEVFPISDIFVYPGYSDTFGFAFTEVISSGIPVVTVNGYARKEIVYNEKEGFIIERPKNLDYYRIGNLENKIIEEIMKRTRFLILNKNVLEKMAKNGRKETESGKFSIKERNKKLKKIYEEALK